MRYTLSSVFNELLYAIPVIYAKKKNPSPKGGIPVIQM